MWMLNFLPEIVIHLTLLAGIVVTFTGFFVGFLPFVNTYKLIIQVLGIALLSFGLYLEGGLSFKQKYELEVAELKEKLAAAEAKSAKVNTEVVIKYVTQRQIVKEKGENIIEYIDREVVKFDKNCPIPDVVIKAHDASALNLPVEQLLTPSTTVNTKVHNEAVNPTSKMILPKK